MTKIRIIVDDNTDGKANIRLVDVQTKGATDDGTGKKKVVYEIHVTVEEPVENG